MRIQAHGDALISAHKKIDQAQIKNYENITLGFHSVLSSAEVWLSFRERYYCVDDELDASLESTQSAIYSDLHGWSRTAAKGAIESIGHMTTLIQMCEPLMQGHRVFTPELLSLLSSSVRSASWNFVDWVHG